MNILNSQRAMPEFVLTVGMCLTLLQPWPSFATADVPHKKVVHYDHNNRHEETLCWTVKLRATGQQSMIQNFYQNFKPLNITNVSEFIGSTSHFTLEEFPEHYVVCHAHDYQDIRKNIEGIHQHHRKLRKISGKHFDKLKQHIERSLQSHDFVEWFSQEVVRKRQKRSVFNDPAYTSQWHLKNHLVPNMDINVTGAWERNVNGEGVTVAVVDDGVEWQNPDLRDNYSHEGSWDLNDEDPDPTPNSLKATNHHGTRCAGEIAAIANNNICGVGVAYKAKISGIRVLDGPMTDSLEAAAFNKKLQVNDVYSCSWGPDDDGRTVDGPHIMAAKAMKYGVDFGRHGYGSIFVVASGNGGRHQDNCNYDGYANSIYTLTIGAVDEMGRMPFYAEECASMLGVTFSSGRAEERDIVTTDWTLHGGSGCTSRHTGTSAAAPLAAAMVALMLQIRPCLTWRDVQYIVILTAVKVDVDMASWQTNGAGLHHSHKHGFGLLKAWRMVNAAKIWETVPWITSYAFGESDVSFKIPKSASGPLEMKHKVTPRDIEGYGLSILENVQVTVTISHPRRGKLQIKLLSPAGTVSVIGAPRPLDNSSYGFQDWTFSTVRCWGETPTGEWTLLVRDTDAGRFGSGYLKKWQIILFGTPLTSDQFQARRRAIEDAMSGQYLNDSFELPCLPPPVVARPDKPLSQKTLKILVLVCAFCFVMGVYESLEYALCYNEEKKEHKAKMKLTARARQLSNQIAANINPDDASESTGLLQSEDIPMETFSVVNETPETRSENREFSENSFKEVNLETEEFSAGSAGYGGGLFNENAFASHNRENSCISASETIASIHSDASHYPDQMSSSSRPIPAHGQGSGQPSLSILHPQQPGYHHGNSHGDDSCDLLATGHEYSEPNICHPPGFLGNHSTPKVTGIDLLDGTTSNNSSRHDNSLNYQLEDVVLR